MQPWVTRTASVVGLIVTLGAIVGAGARWGELNLKVQNHDAAIASNAASIGALEDDVHQAAVAAIAAQKAAEHARAAAQVAAQQSARTAGNVEAILVILRRAEP